MSIEKITKDGIVLAIIIRKDFAEMGIHFVTPNDFSQQLAYMHYTSGKVIQPHTQEPGGRHGE